MKNIYLIGFMGTGKTSVARELAKQKEMTFVDLDDLMEIKEGLAITEIFAQKGETYFRDSEKKILVGVSRNDFQIISCGGGIVMDKDNIALMKNTGIMVCLSARPEVILTRTKNYGHRPLLNVDNPVNKIKELLKERSHFYALADYNIDTSDISLKEVVKKVSELIV
ncbi:MAG: shikimate kinase [Candidatus Omnitrophota bacterium]|nr:AAA family ATPase [Candidatus Omnitrophota bacterium]MBU1929323.1 AAA family ATPase [Candidatus Omnitrophota bacterium]MBU2035615.1 AAA family ATPase [Candidatus Omnitrophota bacterium]MBU2221689.1 AAA family ATPase [Candidatus Omnitrophota bacterium]